MARRIQEAKEQRWDELGERFEAAFARFRESRLYVQLICSAILVALGWLIHLLPDGPWSPAQHGLRWVVTADYDFGGEAARVNRWAKEKGGWAKAGAGIWQQGVSWVTERVGVAPPGQVTPDQVTPGQTMPATPLASTPPTSRPSPAPLGSDQATDVLDAPATGGVASPLQPVEGSVLWEYGWLPPGVGDQFHEGIDFLAKAGSPVVAVLDGTVVAVRQNPKLGRVVEIRHGPVIGVYAQVEGVEVQAGDQVRRGQLIAVVARAQGVEQNLPPHLHFEIRPAQSGEPVDPASYLGLGGKQP